MFKALNEKPYYVCFKILTITCCLPSKRNSLLFFYVCSFIYRPIVFSSWLGILLHLVMTIKNKTGVNISEDIALFSSLGGSYICTIIFTIHYKRWLRLCNSVIDFSRYGQPPTFQKVLKKANVITSIMIFYCAIAIFSYVIEASTEISGCEQRNLEKNLHEICNIMPIWLPVGQVKNFGWWTICFFQLFDCLTIFLSGVSLTFLVYNNTLMIISHVDHFKVLFLETFREEDQFLKNYKLRQCVNYHKHIINLGNELCYLTKITLGTHNLSSAICIGCIANQVLNERSLRSFMFLIGFCTNYFALCHSGQLIINETLSLKDTIFSSTWYLSNSRMMKDVRFILARTQIPITLKTLPLGALSYPLYLKIIKTSYSYVTLLNQAT